MLWARSVQALQELPATQQQALVDGYRRFADTLKVCEHHIAI